MDTICYSENNASTQIVQTVSNKHSEDNLENSKKMDIIRCLWGHTVNNSIPFFAGASLGVILHNLNTATMACNELNIRSANYLDVIEINSLVTKHLRRPLSIYIENDGDGYIARSADLPLYSFEDDIQQAIISLKLEIENLIDELNEDDNFSDEWLNYKTFLNSIIY